MGDNNKSFNGDLALDEFIYFGDGIYAVISIN